MKTICHSLIQSLKQTVFVIALLPFFHDFAFSQSFDQEKMKQSSVVFVGTIVKVGEAGFGQVPVSNNTSIVKVEQMLQQPSAISIKEGDEITLELNARLEAGTQAVFYADGWIVGEGIALRETGHTPLAAAMAAPLRDEVRKEFFVARKKMVDQQVRASLDSADVVALGEVVSVAPSATGPGKRITEHDPEWHDAVVKVRKGVKGVSDGAEIVVRFPMSMDVAFYGMPKLTKGDERMMLLHTDTRSGLGKAQMAGKEVGTYIIESPSDVLESGQLQQVMNLMKR